jgi:hypothetical protein
VPLRSINIADFDSRKWTRTVLNPQAVVNRGVQGKTKGCGLESTAKMEFRS